MFDDDGEGYPRRIVGRETHEPGMRRRAADFGGAGLAGNRHGVPGERTSGAGGHHFPHRTAKERRVLRTYPADLRRAPLTLRAHERRLTDRAIRRYRSNRTRHS